ncbi:BspA family leucine-rich repeat surface protein [Mycoplasma mycoides]|uniref:BspA family leucine-rich repeat surface protein n=1 Tax=Mycoplasma mycoides TaxID=2102 RepID=UPI00034B00A7|nr:BspA family leucine-rich repeat surface protein [Mycoplasma mycoides]EXU60641.1 Hypothetical protein, predicted lipoprotein, DUF285 family [Mycoplasma mycoides subsp. capri PG3]QVK04596.1 DUF285 domain-containing protein [Mycoplasma mycoides subsp. capri]
MKHLLKIISSLTVLSTSVLAVSCTNKSEQNNKDQLPNNKDNTENKDKKEEKDQPQADQPSDHPKEEPKIEISEEEKQEVIDALQKVFKEQEDAFGSFHTHQEVLDQLKVYLNDNKIKHLDHLKLTNEKEKNTNLKVDTEHKKLNKINLSFFDKNIIFSPKKVLENEVQDKYIDKKLIQVGYKLDNSITRINLKQINKNTTQVPRHLPLKINSFNESFKNLESSKIDNLDKWNTRNIKYMTETFSETSSFNQDLNSWDVSGVIDMTNMFAGAKKFNQSLNSWNTANVKSMSGMFWEAESFNGNISNWNVMNVDDMSVMFSGAKNFNQDISRWDTSKVGSMKGMFSDAKSFNQDISRWDTSKVGTMEQMFENAKSFNQNLKRWNVEKVTHAENFRRGTENNFLEENQPNFGPNTAK